MEEEDTKHHHVIAYTCEPHAQKPSGLCSYPLAHRCEALLNVQGAVEMAQQLRALTALTEDLSSQNAG